MLKACLAFMIYTKELYFTDFDCFQDLDVDQELAVAIQLRL